MTIAPVQPDSMSFRFSLARTATTMTITVVGRVNALNGTPIRKRALAEIADGAVWITIDLKAVESIDKRAFGDLLSIAQHARREGGAVTVLDANAQVLRGFHDWGVAQAFTFAVSGDTQSQRPSVEDIRARDLRRKMESLEDHKAAACNSCRWGFEDDYDMAAVIRLARQHARETGHTVRVQMHREVVG